jgi:hypothetical protein
MVEDDIEKNLNKEEDKSVETSIDNKNSNEKIDPTKK